MINFLEAVAKPQGLIKVTFLFEATRPSLDSWTPDLGNSMGKIYQGDDLGHHLPFF
jgi:hypothetical protein